MRWIRDKFGAGLYCEESNALGPLVSIGSVFGLWPLEKDNVSLRIRWCIPTLSMIIVMLLSTYDSYLNCVDLEDSGDFIYSVIFGILGLSKMIFYYKYRDVLRINVVSAIDDWSSEDSKNFRSMMCNYRSKYTTVTKYLLIFGFCASIMWIIKVLYIDPDMMIVVDRAKNSQHGNVTTALKMRFLLPVACAFSDVPQSWFWTVMVFQLFPFTIVSGAHLCCDGFFIAITSHLCCQLEILKIKFATFPNVENEMELREKFGLLIARHAHLLKLAKQLETAFSIIMFTQILMNVAAWTIAGFNFLVLLKKREMTSAMTNALIMQFTLAQTFIYCYIGEWLKCQGEDIAQSVYHCRWYLMPSSVSKNVVFIIIRSRRPIGLTAGNFFQMTRSTITTTLKAAASYLSVLRIMIKDT